jgi:hypothetical protein
MILNPTPITPSTFGGMWITSLQIVLPANGRPGVYSARFLPYDGAYLLSTGGKSVGSSNLTAKRAGDQQFDAMMNALVSEVKRQANRQDDPAVITVSAPNPQQAVVATVIFADHSVHRVANCFALAGTDATFAQVFVGAMAELARQADFPYTP